jgi:restriction system protein
MNNTPMPSSAELESAVIKAIESKGGNSTNTEIYQWVITNLKISQSQLEIMRSGKRSEIEYRLAWARTRASKKGLIHRIGPSSWSLTAK